MGPINGRSVVRIALVDTRVDINLSALKFILQIFLEQNKLLAFLCTPILALNPQYPTGVIVVVTIKLFFCDGLKLGI